MPSTPSIEWSGIDPQRFEQLCSDLVRETLAASDRLEYRAESMPQQADFQKDGVLESCRFERLSPPVMFSFKTSDPLGATAAASKSITAEFLKRLPRLLSEKPKSIVLWANHDFRPRDTRRIKQAMPRGVRVLVEGRSQLEERLLLHPHLLTRYFGWSEFVQCFHSTDREGLRAALAGGPLAQAVPSAGEPHAIEGKDVSGRRLRLLGGPGSGKSFCLYRVVTAMPNAVVVLLRSLDRALVWEHLSRVLHHARRPVAVVVDNLHEFVNEACATDVLGPMLDSREARDKAPTVLVSHWTTKRLDVERAIPATQWARWGFEDISIDDPPREFMERVVGAACAQLEIDADDSMVRAFVTEICEWENTPACAVASLLPYRGTAIKGEHGFHPVSLKVRDATWRHLFLDLCTQGTQAEATVLRAMSALRWSGDRGCPLDTVKAVATHVGGASSEEVEDAIERLERSGWVQREVATLRSHDLQIFPTTVGLHDSDRPSLFLERFAQAVSDDTIATIRPNRLNVLHHLGEMYWHMGLWERCARFNTLILAEEPHSIRALCNRAVCYLKSQRVEDAIADLRCARGADPESVGPARLLCGVLHRHGRTDEALAVLNEFKGRKPADTRAWAFLAQAYSQLRERRKAIECARHLVREHPGDPEAKALLVQSLWLANHREDARRLLDRSLRRWPEAGSLLHVRADLEEQWHGPERALPFAERGLRANPNNPALHALAAWLNMMAGHVDRAYEIASIASELFRSWPDLLAVWGLLLERRGRLAEAEAALRRALEQNDHVSDVYRPNLLLGLGRVSIRAGELQDAEEWFGLAAKAGVDPVFMLRTKSEALQLAGRTAEARDALRQAAELRRDDPDLWFELALLSSKLGNASETASSLDAALALAPNKLEYQFLRGVVFKQAGKAEHAAGHFRQAVALDPQMRDGWKELALAMYHLGSPSEAAEAFEKAIDLGAEDDTTHLAFAWTLRGLERPQEAIIHCQAVLSRSPDDPRAHAIAASCHFDLRNRPRAVRSMKRALSAKSDEDLWPMLVRIALEAGMAADAFAAFDRGVTQGWCAHRLGRDVVNALLVFAVKRGRDQDTMTVLQCIHDGFGPDPTNLLNMARCYLNLGQPDAALNHYAELLRQSPLHLHVVQERARLLIGLGRPTGLFEPTSQLYAELPAWLKETYVALAWLAKGDRTACAAHFLRGIGLLRDPTDLDEGDAYSLARVVGAMGIRAEVASLVTERLNLGGLGAAELHFAGWLLERPSLLRDALALEPSRIHLTADVALHEALTANRTEAIRVARAGLLLHPQTPGTLAKLGRALLLAGAPADETLRVAEEALRIAGARQSIWAAQHLKAESLNALDRWDEALEAGQEALREQRTSLGYSAVIRSLSALGRKQEALDVAEQAYRDFPDDIELKVARALLLNLAGRDKECMALVRGMGPAAAVMVTPLLDLADCLQRARRFAEAGKAYNAARRNLEAAGTESLRGYHVRATAGEVKVLVAQKKPRRALSVLNSMGENYLVESGLWEVKAALCGQQFGDDAEALRLADLRILAHPEDGMAHWYRAVALCRTKRFEAALDALDRSAALGRTHSATTLNLRGQILLALHRPEDAIDAVYEGCDLGYRQENRADLSAVGTVLAALPQCATPPARGIQLAAALLGAYCGPHRNIRAAKSVLSRLRRVGWDSVKAEAAQGVRASTAAIALLQKVERWLNDDAASGNGGTSPADNAPVPGTFIENLLEASLRERWRAPRRVQQRSARATEGGGDSGRRRPRTRRTRQLS